jgi:L-ribulokinase
MVIGTSICDLVVHPEEIALEGITGVAKDGILPGLYGYEAGQPATGDMLGWFAESLANAGTAGSVGSRLGELERGAAALAPAQAGLTLQTGAADIYRALLESIAFGNKAIMDNFTAGGLELEDIVACGGIAEKSPLLMRLIADVSGLPVRVPASSQVPARGSALFGAVAAGPVASGFAGAAQVPQRPTSRCTASSRTCTTPWGEARRLGYMTSSN